MLVLVLLLLTLLKLCLIVACSEVRVLFRARQALGPGWSLYLTSLGQNQLPSSFRLWSEFSYLTL